jgi:hypothetical protein
MNRSLLSVSLLVLSLGLAQADDIDLNNGLIGYWPFNGNAVDYSGNGNDGTVLSNASFVEAPDGGRQVLQTVIDSTGQGHVTVTFPESLVPGTMASDVQLSGSIWVQFDDHIPQPGLSSQGILQCSPGLLYIVRQLSNAYLLSVLKNPDGSGQSLNSWSNSITDDNVWYHVAWTFQASEDEEVGTFRWYLNGTLNREYIGAYLTSSGTTTMNVGVGYLGASNNEKIAELRLYDRILTADEIAVLANPNAMNGANVGFAWDATSIPTGNAPFTVDPSSLALELTDAYGIPLSSYEDSSRIPDLYYTIVSGPAIHNANGDIEFLGGGDVVLKLETPGNAYYAATSQEVTVSANGTAFNNALWNNERGTGFFITDNAEAGVVTLGEEAVRIDVDGNVGIGVTQPQAALDVNGNTQVSGSLQAANGIVKVTESGDLVINEGQSNEIRLGADGSAHFPKYGDIKMLGEE